MKKRVFTVASLAMLSCRAVLGIEDLPGDGGASASSSSSSGGTTGDSGAKDTGASTLDAGGGDGGCAAKAEGDCIKCCRDAHQGNMQFDSVVRGSQCVCGPASPCASACGGAGNFCDGGDPKLVGMQCFTCSDQEMLQSTADCPQKLDELATTGELGVCLKSCKH